MDQMDFIFFVVLAVSAFWIGLAVWHGLLSLRKMHAMVLVAFLALSGVVAVIGDKTNGLLRVIGPLWSPPPATVTVTETDIAQGWRVESVTTNETYSYEMPTNAVYVSNWHVHGARSSFGNHKVDFGAIRSRGTRDPTADEWAFPLGTNFESFTAFWYFVDGRIRPTPRDAAREIRAAGGPMFAMSGASRLWAAEDYDGSRVLTWENFFVGNDTNTPVNAQIRLYANGDFTTCSNEVMTICRRVEPFDWDGDGLANPIDPDPYTNSGDCHGTCAAWYNVACSNILTAVDGDYGVELTWLGGVNSNAYYFVPVVAESGPAEIVFNASQAGNLGSPIVVAAGGATNLVPLLVGVEYAVTSSVPISVSTPADGFAQVVVDSPSTCRIHWPVNFIFTETVGVAMRSGNVTRTYEVTANPFDPGGVFSWNPPGGCNCITFSGSQVIFGCSSACTCAGVCLAVGSFEYEGLTFPVSGGECRCGFYDQARPAVSQEDGPCVSIGFSGSAVIFEDAYLNGPGAWRPKRSTRTWLTVYANGGPSGGVLSLTSQNLARLSPVACGPVVLPSTLNLAPDETFCVQFLFDGEQQSAMANDILVSGSLLPHGANESLQSSASLTCVKLLLTPQNSISSFNNRHTWGVGESIVCSWLPVSAQIAISDNGGGEIIGQGDSFRIYRSPLQAAANMIAVTSGNVQYVPTCEVKMPESVFVGRAFEEPSNVQAGTAGGVEMHLEVFVAPTNVSFRALSFVEVPSSESVVTGYFQNAAFSAMWHHDESMGAGQWHPIGMDNFFFDDYPSMNEELPAPWSAGALHWIIPIGWRLSGTESVTNTLSNSVQQRFDLSPSGRLRLTKLGRWVERDPDGTTRCSEGVQPL